MLTWLYSIRLELENMGNDQLIEPPGDMQPDDNLVDQAGLEIRKLYTLSMLLEKAAAEAQIAARYDPDSQKRSQSEEKIYELTQKAKVVRDIFWITLRDEYGLWSKDSIGVRKGWQVVWNEDRGPTLGDFLGGFLRPGP